MAEEKYTNIEIEVTDETAEKIEKIAEKLGISIEETISRILRWALAKAYTVNDEIHLEKAEEVEQFAREAGITIEEAAGCLLIRDLKAMEEK